MPAASIFSDSYSTLVSREDFGKAPATRPAEPMMPPARATHSGPAPRIPVDEARDHVLTALACRTGIQPKEVLGKSRIGSVVYARKLTSAGLRAAGYSFACIGSALDLHHSSIMHQVNEIYAASRFHVDIAADLVWAIHAADELAGT